MPSDDIHLRRGGRRYRVTYVGTHPRIYPYSVLKWRRGEWGVEWEYGKSTHMPTHVRILIDRAARIAEALTDME